MALLEGFFPASKFLCLSNPEEICTIAQPPSSSAKSPTLIARVQKDKKSIVLIHGYKRKRQSSPNLDEAHQEDSTLNESEIGIEIVSLASGSIDVTALAFVHLGRKEGLHLVVGFSHGGVSVLNARGSVCLSFAVTKRGVTKIRGPSSNIPIPHGATCAGDVLFLHEDGYVSSVPLVSIHAAIYKPLDSGDMYLEGSCLGNLDDGNAIDVVAVECQPVGNIFERADKKYLATVGSNPFLGLHPRAEAPTFDEILQNGVVGSAGAALFQLAKTAFLGGGKSSQQQHDDAVANSLKTRKAAGLVKIENLLPGTKLASVYTPSHQRWEDSGRRGQVLEPSPSGVMAAATDSYGRVMVVCLKTLRPIRMWKGYRDAQVAWIRSPDGDDILHLAIFAPRRGLLELWAASESPPWLSRIAAERVPNGSNARLIAEGTARTAYMLRLNTGKMDRLVLPSMSYAELGVGVGSAPTTTGAEQFRNLQKLVEHCQKSSVGDLWGAPQTIHKMMEELKSPQMLMQACSALLRAHLKHNAELVVEFATAWCPSGANSGKQQDTISADAVCAPSRRLLDVLRWSCSRIAECSASDAAAFSERLSAEKEQLAMYVEFLSLAAGHNQSRWGLPDEFSGQIKANHYHEKWSDTCLGSMLRLRADRELWRPSVESNEGDQSNKSETDFKPDHVEAYMRWWYDALRKLGEPMPAWPEVRALFAVYVIPGTEFNAPAHPEEAHMPEDAPPGSWVAEVLPYSAFRPSPIGAPSKKLLDFVLQAFLLSSMAPALSKVVKVLAWAPLARTTKSHAKELERDPTQKKRRKPEAKVYTAPPWDNVGDPVIVCAEKCLQWFYSTPLDVLLETDFPPPKKDGLDQQGSGESNEEEPAEQQQQQSHLDISDSFPRITSYEQVLNVSDSLLAARPAWLPSVSGSPLMRGLRASFESQPKVFIWQMLSCPAWQLPHAILLCHMLAACLQPTQTASSTGQQPNMGYNRQGSQTLQHPLVVDWFEVINGLCQQLMIEFDMAVGLTTDPLTCVDDQNPTRSPPIITGHRIIFCWPVLVGSYNAEMLQRVPQEAQAEIMRQRCSILATAGSKGASFWDIDELPLTNGLYAFYF